MRKNGDSTSALGFIIGWGALLLGFILEGGYLPSLIGISALIIIIGGTFGALIISFGLGEIKKIPGLIVQANKGTPEITRDVIEVFITFSEKARREGILSLEEDVEELNDPFLRKSLKLAVDGTDPEIIHTVMENEIYLFETRKKEEAAIFDAAGGYSPTMGIVGTVMGLVLVLGRLGGDANELGRSIATAFIATLYGIGLANLFWLPIGYRLKNNMKKEKLKKELAVMAILSLIAGDNPSILRDKLDAFLVGKEQELFRQSNKEEK